MNGSRNHTRRPDNAPQWGAAWNGNQLEVSRVAMVGDPWLFSNRAVFENHYRHRVLRSFCGISAHLSAYICRTPACTCMQLRVVSSVVVWVVVGAVVAGVCADYARGCLGGAPRGRR